MNIKDIKKIVELMLANDLIEFEMEEEGRRVAIKRGSLSASPVVAPSATLPAVLPAAQTAAAAQPSAPADEEENCELVKAPFVGTFYAAPSPDSPPYVKVGQKVSPDSVLCIVEAMKVMNEIKAEIHGVIKEIMVDNSRPVQFGQPMFKIEKT